MLDFTFPDATAAEGEQCVANPSTETHTGDPAEVRHRKNHLRWTVVCTDLNATASRDKLATFNRIANELGTRIVFPVGDVQMEKSLLIRQRLPESNSTRTQIR